MKINGIEIKKKLIKDDDRKYYFSVNKHAHDIEYYWNHLSNIVDDALINQDEDSIGKDLLNKYGSKFIFALDDFNNEKVLPLFETILSNNQNGVCKLTGPEIGLAKDIVAWAEGTRSGEFGDTSIGPAWDYIKNFIKSDAVKDSKLVNDSISKEARKMCREVKSIMEDDLKDGKKIIIGDFHFSYNDDTERYKVEDYNTFEALEHHDLEKLKEIIKWRIYDDDNFANNIKNNSYREDFFYDSKLKKDSEIDFSNDYIKVNGNKVIISYDKIPVEDDDGREIEIDYEYEQDKNTVIEAIEDIINAEEPIADEDFEKLLKDHEEEVAKYFAEKAIEEAQETFDPDEYYSNKREAEEADRVNDSEIERVYFDKDGTLVFQYYFKSKDGVNSPYGYVPKLGDIYERLYTYSKDSDNSNYEDYNEKVKYISEHTDEFIPKYEKYLLDDFRDDAEDEFYAKLFDYED